MSKNKKLITAILIVLIVIVVIITVIVNINNKSNDKTKTTIKDNVAENDVVIEDVTFSEITKVYDGGITNLSAKMLNNTKDVKNFTVQIVLKDETGKEVKSMMQVVENLEPGRVKVFTTGIAGDYSSIKNIEFKVVEG
jgi:preprotein translocase subunit YajC